MADISKDRLKARIKALENIVESLDQHVAMLQNDLYNEQIRNGNLETLVTTRPGSKTIED
jgi:chaperonin cofactor prefoldin